MEAPEDSVPCEDFASCGVAQYQNRQYPKNAKQQDSYFVVEDLGATFGAHLGNTDRVALYGVADGHGEFGEVSANFIRRHLPPQLAQSRHFASGHLDAALLEAFSQTELLQQSSGLPLWASGACVTAAAVSPSHIVVANCGDCRCVLAEQGQARDLSTDHNVESASPEEMRRILSAGGTITPDMRVTVAGAPGRLATTRSLGDYWAKPQGPPEGHVVTAMPEVRTLARHPSQEYLVLASDGVFGFMSSQDVVSICLSQAKQLPAGAPLSGLGHALVCAAVHNRRSDDNCTCLVVDLSRVDAAFATVKSQPSSPSRPLMTPQEVRMPFQWPQQANGKEVDLSSPQSGQFSLPTGAEKSAMLGLETGSIRVPVSGRLPGDHRKRPDAAGALPKEDSDNTSLPSSAPAAVDEVCWCPWCVGMNQDGDAENVVLGSFERWRLHMHEQHFDKLVGAYGPDEIVPCYWCCRPCVTKKGQNKSMNRLPFWGSHERVCRENPSKPVLPGQARSSEGSQTSGSGERRWGVSGGQVHRGPPRRGASSGGIPLVAAGNPQSGGGASPDSRYRDLRDLRDVRDLRDFTGQAGSGMVRRMVDDAGYRTPPAGSVRGGSDAGLMSSPEQLQELSASPKGLLNGTLAEASGGRGAATGGRRRAL
eukprot:TRINITY_DN19634_c0_g1_i2.p1 TRINITY_DN19634_c0_g1~~TRINITY_DN19634_c0_g1_i2.p1  ORF type:complete len:649 (+),score=101.38 TRINITY_DN19634_c0_g1_i2:84-2030(+)